MNTVYVPFTEIHLLKPLDALTYASPYGVLSGWVDEIGDDWVSIFNGTGPWRVYIDHAAEGLLEKPEVVPA